LQPAETAATEYVYIIARSDLPISYRACQATHAAWEAGRQAFVSSDHIHPHFALCEIANEAKLRKFSEKLTAAGIRHALWYESDLNDQLTSIATEPLSGERRRLFKNLQLFKLHGYDLHSQNAILPCPQKGASNE
jgi:hypothetical protein